MILEVRNLSTHFVVRHGPLGRFQHPDHVIKAVEGVSFNVEPRGVFGVVGESGSGKTTLARTMLRLCPSSRGSVLYNGRSVFDMDATALKQYRREVQPVFQDADSTLDPRQTVASVLEEPLLIHGLGSRHERRRRLESVLEHVNLSMALLGRHPSELSGGQRQRVAMGRALLLEPHVLIADEPTSGLDPLVATQLLSLLLRLRGERGLSLVLISHDLDTVAYAADRVGVMYRGRMVEVIDGNAFKTGALHPYSRVLLGLESETTPHVLEEGVHEHAHLLEEGCPYAAYCSRHLRECHHEFPALRETWPGHLVACHAVR